MDGVILYGPPAAGKDTVTRALHYIDSQYVLYPRIKVGPGRVEGYRTLTHQALDERRLAGDIIWENSRYKATYAIDRTELLHRLRQHVPVLHVGQTEAVSAVVDAVPDVQWLTVYLWCSREIARQRLIDREATDLGARLHAWDQTPPLRTADLIVDTGGTAPNDVARRVHEHVENRRYRESNNVAE